MPIETIDRTFVQSGFDFELLLGARGISYLLLTAIEAGELKTRFTYSYADAEGARHEYVFRIRGPSDLVRLYEPHREAEVPLLAEGSFDCEVLFEHPSGADVRITLMMDTEPVEPPGDPLPTSGMDVFVRFDLVRAFDDDGRLDSVELGLELVDIAGPFVDAIVAVSRRSKEDVLRDLKYEFDRAIVLSDAIGTLDDVQWLKLPAEGERRAALALLGNLRLKVGPLPHQFLAARGDVDSAKNFLPTESDIAFATRAELFDDLSTDAFQRLAEKDGGGEYGYPLRDPSKLDDREWGPRGKVVGSIERVRVRGISLFPQEGDPSGDGTLATQLRITTHAKYVVNNWPDPDVAIEVNATPRLAEDGSLTWDLKTDFDVDLLNHILPLAGIALLFAVYGAGILAAGVVFAIENKYESELRANAAASIEEQVEASLFDVLPSRLTVFRKRWDPFYETLHQLVTLPQGLVVERGGMTFWGSAAVGKETRTVNHVVIRDEQRDEAGEVTHLRYRVRDATELTDQFTDFAPGTDRREFERHDPLRDPDLVQLSLEQVAERLEDRLLLGSIPYQARRVEIQDNQIASLSVISQREINEEADILIDAFRERTAVEVEAERGAEFRLQVIEQFQALGITPTEEQIQAGVQGRLEKEVNRLQSEFEEGELSDLLRDAVAPLLRFDLAPREFAALEDQGVLTLPRLQLVKPVTGRAYYRDRPDRLPEDNLLALPRYKRALLGT